MSSSITTTLTVGVGLAVVPAVADGELGSVMGSMLLNVHVPTTHTTSLAAERAQEAGGAAAVRPARHRLGSLATSLRPVRSCDQDACRHAARRPEARVDQRNGTFARVVPAAASGRQPTPDSRRCRLWDRQPALAAGGSIPERSICGRRHEGGQPGSLPDARCASRIRLYACASMAGAH